MSYIFLRERGEESSAECFSDIPAYVLSRLSITADRSCFSGSETESCRVFLSGMMFGLLTVALGVDWLMFCVGASRAKTSAPAAKDSASPEEEADYGQRWLALSLKFDPATSSWKTLRSLYSEDSDWSSLTLPKWGLMRGGELFRLHPSALPTSGNDYGLLDSTPTKVMPVESKNPKERIYYLKSGLPRKESKKGVSGSVNWAQLMLLKGFLPTAKLCEYYMGWPIGWTDLQPLETDRFQRWQQSHGSNLEVDCESEIRIGYAID